MGQGVRVGVVQPVLGGVRGCAECAEQFLVAGTAQVELRSGRV